MRSNFFEHSLSLHFLLAILIFKANLNIEVSFTENISLVFLARGLFLQVRENRATPEVISKTLANYLKTSKNPIHSSTACLINLERCYNNPQASKVTAELDACSVTGLWYLWRESEIRGLLNSMLFPPNLYHHK